MAANAQALRRRMPASLTCSLMSLLPEEVEEVEGGGRFESAATIAGIAFSPLTAAAVPELDTAIAVAVARLPVISGDELPLLGRLFGLVGWAARKSSVLTGSSIGTCTSSPAVIPAGPGLVWDGCAMSVGKQSCGSPSQPEFCGQQGPFSVWLVSGWLLRCGCELGLLSAF